MSDPDEEIKKVIAKLKRLAGDRYGGQSNLAKDIGVDRQRLNDWITDKRTPDLKSWLKIQAFLNGL
jgi:DNA-binding XRE family transcriptional regulator